MLRKEIKVDGDSDMIKSNFHFIKCDVIGNLIGSHKHPRPILNFQKSHPNQIGYIFDDQIDK